MRLIKLLSTESIAGFSLSALASVLSGVMAMAALVLLFQYIGENPKAPVSWWEFAAVCAAAILSRGVSRSLLEDIGRKAILRVRVQWARQIAAAPLSNIEELGRARLMATFTGDVLTVAAVLPNLVLLCANLSFVTTCFLYLAWLSVQKCLTVLAIVTAGVTAHHMFQRRSVKRIRQLRRHWEDVLQDFHALVDGIKELKLNAARREQTLRLFESRVEELHESVKSQSTSYAGAERGTQLLFYLALGVAIFNLDGVPEDRHLLAGYSISIIYMMGPLRGVIGVMRDLREANVALDRLRDVGIRLDREQDDHSAEAVGIQHFEPGRKWRELRLVGITHVYRSESDGAEFALGPVDLVVNPGEIIFVVGGNGSGKTTLAKLITGLYTPSAGQILLDGRLITDSNRDRYRQYFAAIFNDGYVFDTLVGPSDHERDLHGEQLLEFLRIADKVEIRGGILSTVAKLSQGERKRLALFLALLDDRAIYVFDEWAAEQDPAFKEVFYEQIIHDLRGQGKLVIVISHDDRYFKFADRILTLERGEAPVLQCTEARYVASV